MTGKTTFNNILRPAIPSQVWGLKVHLTFEAITEKGLFRMSQRASQLHYAGLKFVWRPYGEMPDEYEHPKYIFVIELISLLQSMVEFNSCI